jgi:hypothetical protein
MDFCFERGFLLADGGRMAICLGARDTKNMYLVSNYYPTSLSIYIYQPHQDVCLHGGTPFAVCTGQQEVTIEIKAYGPVQNVPMEEGLKLFRNAESLSVNELLAIAYQKMSGRQS